MIFFDNASHAPHWKIAGFTINAYDILIQR